ncbi:unnamed protein product, partial [Meganyctiphanes norvegica]
ILLLLVLLAISPGIPPWTTFSEFSVKPPLPLSGALAPNEILDGAKRLFEGEIGGPESIAWRRTDEIFVGISDGTIQKIHGESFSQISKVTQMGEACDKPYKKKSGRPLGMRFAPNGRLLVADAFYGIYSVDVDTGEKECLVSPDDLIEGKPFKFPDDVDIDAENNIYWSDASTIADFTDGLLEFMSDPTGRLVKYDSQTKTNTVLMDKIHFANGVQLSPNQDFILLSETARSRVHRYWLKGPKTGQSEIFIDQLPGSPDNIRPRPDGGYYISLCGTKNADNLDEIETADKINRHPMFRKIICRIFACIQLTCNTLNKLIPYSILEEISHKIFSFDILINALKDYLTIVVEVDENGNIIGSLQGSTGKVRLISETAHVGDNIFFGTPYMNFLGHLYVGGDKERKIIEKEEDIIYDVEIEEDSGSLIEDGEGDIIYDVDYEEYNSSIEDMEEDIYDIENKEDSGSSI